MNVNFDCGECGASFMIDDDMEEFTSGVWLLANRFVNAHERCGFVSKETRDPEVSDTQVKLSSLFNGK